MSHDGPHEFTPNEKEKFEEIYQAHRNHQEKKVKKLMAKLTPLEEDHYDLYLRAAEEAITTNNSILHHHGQKKLSISAEEPEPKNPNDKKKRGGCNIQ